MQDLMDIITRYMGGTPVEEKSRSEIAWHGKMYKEIETLFSREIALYKNRLFIQQALNHFWNDAHANLQRKNLGDKERENYELQKQEASRILKDFENDII